MKFHARTRTFVHPCEFLSFQSISLFTIQKQNGNITPIYIWENHLPLLTSSSSNWKSVSHIVSVCECLWLNLSRCFATNVVHRYFIYFYITSMSFKWILCKHAISWKNADDPLCSFHETYFIKLEYYGRRKKKKMKRRNTKSVFFQVHILQQKFRSIAYSMFEKIHQSLFQIIIISNQDKIQLMKINWLRSGTVFFYEKKIIDEIFVDG